LPQRFYLLYGPDEFAAAEYVDDLKAELGDPSLAALNTTLVDGRTVTLTELRSICDTLPFLAARRLVVVEGWLTRLLARAEPDEDEAAEAGDEPRAPQRRTGVVGAGAGGGGGAARETMAALADYLAHLPESTLLVLLEKRDLPERNLLLKAASGAEWGLVKRFDLPKGEALVRWIRARAKAEGGEFTREAAESLADVESDPRALGHEIVKLLTYVGFERPVELDDVQTLTPAGGEAKVFDLVDAIGQRRGPQAMRELHKLLETAEPLYVLSMIVRQYRLLLQAKELLGERATEAEISKALGLHPFPTGKVCAQARNFSLDGLERIYRRLLDYDVGIKTGQIEAATALDTLVGALTAN
jgi:DNA polymerase-3 subunit delta